ncbi:hypothetical protein FGO68_gene14084 [Halteria grandinella]|uniref:Uncharacterized protein n=1 Tax=Halteria grandinella TaxID=5974 RepID=A0A8J8P2C8_HALGN|nr:hypothetical protein FGO68_gene14084 [Halteria grandinella]
MKTLSKMLINTKPLINSNFQWDTQPNRLRESLQALAQAMKFPITSFSVLSLKIFKERDCPPTITIQTWILSLCREADTAWRKLRAATRHRKLCPRKYTLTSCQNRGSERSCLTIIY